LINQISKTIADTSKSLTYIGMTPPMLNKIFDVVTTRYTSRKNYVSEDLERIKRFIAETKDSAFSLKLDYKVPSLEEVDPNRVF